MLRINHILVVLILIGGAYLLRLLHISPADILTVAQEKTVQFGNDSRALLNGEYQTKIAGSLKAEAEKIAVPASSSVDDGELQQELAAARKQMLKDRADALEKHSGELLKGDVESLKRQVIENARNAGSQQ